MALKGQPNSTRVPFAESCMEFNFASEQFWGRAARAPRSRKRFEALVILVLEYLVFRGQSPQDNRQGLLSSFAESRRRV
jgi:hypothetical protein